MARLFVGAKDPERRAEAERGDLDVDGSPFLAYRKRTLTYAVQVAEPFEVETLEGLHTGKAGDWLAIGAHGEMYPIDAAVFAESYELVAQEVP